MREDDFTYYNRRANEELTAAANAEDVLSARLHRKLADLMRSRADKISPHAQTFQSSDAA
jgi:hypothetical protein